MPSVRWMNVAYKYFITLKYACPNVLSTVGLWKNLISKISLNRVYECEWRYLWVCAHCFVVALVQIVLLITVHGNGIIALPPFTTKATTKKPIQFLTNHIWSNNFCYRYGWIDKLKDWQNSESLEHVIHEYNVSPLSVATTTTSTATSNQNILTFHSFHFSVPGITKTLQISKVNTSSVFWFLYILYMFASYIQ